MIICSTRLSLHILLHEKNTFSLKCNFFFTNNAQILHNCPVLSCNSPNEHCKAQRNKNSKLSCSWRQNTRISNFRCQQSMNWMGFIFCNTFGKHHIAVFFMVSGVTPFDETKVDNHTQQHLGVKAKNQGFHREWSSTKESKFPQIRIEEEVHHCYTPFHTLQNIFTSLTRNQGGRVIVKIITSNIFGWWLTI